MPRSYNHVPMFKYGAMQKAGGAGSISDFRFVESYGTLIDDFSGTNWVYAEQQVDGDGTPQDTTHFKAGTSAYKINYPAAQTRATLTSTFSAVDFTGNNAFYLWFYVDITGDEYQIKLRFEDGAKNNSYTYEPDELFTDSGWNLMIFPWADGTDPTTDITAITDIIVTIEDVAPGGDALNIWFDSLYGGAMIRPKLILSFDDCVDVHKTEAHDYMQPKGLVGSCSIPSSLVDGANKLSTSDINTMYGNGWEFVTHGVVNSDTVSSLGAGGYLRQANTCRDFLETNSWTGSEDIIVWNGCGTSLDGIQSARNAGFEAARRCGSQGDDLYATPGHPNDKDLHGFNEHALVGRIHNFGDTVANNTDFVDKLISCGAAGHLIFHDIDAGASGDQDITVVDFQAIIDHIKTKVDAGLIDVITFKQYLNGLKLPTRVYNAHTALLDGTNDWFQTNFGANPAGVTANSQEGTISGWMKRGTTGLEGLFYNNGRITIQITGGDQIFVDLEDETNTGVFTYSTVETIADTNWHHIIFSWDSATGDFYFYIDGTQATLTELTTPTTQTVDWTRTTWTLGADNALTAPFNGCLSEWWVAQEYIDLTDASELAKFISGGKPVSLGSDGSVPTGSAPIFYFNQSAAELGLDNSDNENDLTAVGAAAKCSTSPSD